MQLKGMKGMFRVVVALFSLGLMLGCVGMERTPPNRLPGYIYVPKVLVDAERALDEARKKGKDKECPEEFNAAEARVAEAFRRYMACNPPESVQVNIACAPLACDLTPKKTIKKGESVTLTMTTSGDVASAELEGKRAGIKGETRTVTPTVTTTYVGSVADFSGHSSTCFVTIEVISPPPPTCDLKADREKIELGESVTLTLTTFGEAASAMLDETPVTPTGGTKRVEPVSAGRFTAKVVGPGGSNTCSVSVSVRLILHVHFPFDRPGAGEDAQWFRNPDADNPKDAGDPSHKEKIPFENAELKNNSAELKKAIEFVKSNKGAFITVTGHTDSIERKPGYNQSLSERRAHALKEYLVEQQAIDPNRIKTEGLGAREPVAANKTPDGKDNPEGRAKNRRVEITSEAISSR